MGAFTETSTAPDQAVVAVNLGEQGPSSISEAVVHLIYQYQHQYIYIAPYKYLMALFTTEIG